MSKKHKSENKLKPKKNWFLVRVKISKDRKKQIDAFYNITKESMDIFYKSKEWRTLKEWVYQRYEHVCVKSGSVQGLSVDHIRPISCHPRLALRTGNLRILCLECNRKKSYIMATRKDMDMSKLPVIKDSISSFKFENEDELIKKFFPKKEAPSINFP